MLYSKINLYVPHTHTHTQKFSTKFIVLLLSLFSLQLMAQDPTCTVNGLPDLTYFDLNTNFDQNEYTVKVYFRIFRKDDGTDGYDKAKLPMVQGILNSAYNSHGIYFDFECDEEYIEEPSSDPDGSLFIDNLALAQLAYDGAAPISSMFPAIEVTWCDFLSQAPVIADGINIFIGDNLGLSAFTTKARAGSIPSNVIVLFDELAIESSTIVHEMGHALGLLHTATGSLQNHLIWPSNVCNANALPCFACPDIVYETYSCASSSYVTGNYCAEHMNNGNDAGDFIPDTPPSNQFIEEGHGVSNCQLDQGPIFNPLYFPQQQIPLVDPLGNSYNPSLDNFMSTSFRTCRNNFTDNQVHVMKNHLELCPVLTPVVSPNPAKGRCVCPYDVAQIYLDDIVSWSEVITEYQLDPQELNQVELVIDQDLIIDVDYTFNGVTFNFSENASMVIDNFSEVVIKENSVLTTCGEIWDGVQVLGGSRLETFEVLFEKTHTAIKAENFSNVKIWNTNINQHTLGFAGIELNNIVNVELISSVNISNGFYGIYADGYFAQLPIFDGTITVDGIGIRIIQTPSSFSSIVDVTINAYSGISINGGTGNMIVWNSISYKQQGHGIFANGSNGVFISRNDVGYQGIYGRTGIRVNGSTGASIVQNPSIKAYCTGVMAENYVGTINDNPFIYVDGLCDQVGGGIALSNSMGVSSDESEINGNILHVSNSIFGISSQVSTHYGIKNNEINISGSDALQGIQVIGSDYIDVEENVIIGTENETGVYVDNSEMGLFKCNDYIDLELGFHGFKHNVSLEIIREDFLSTDIDIEIHGVIGAQDFHGNKFHQNGFCNAIGMSIQEIEASTFTYNSIIDKNEPDNPNPISWFIDDDSSSSVPACADDSPKNDEGIFSYMSDILQNQREENYNVYQTSLFQVLDLDHDIIPDEFLHQFEKSVQAIVWAGYLRQSYENIRMFDFSSMEFIAELQEEFQNTLDNAEQLDIIKDIAMHINSDSIEIHSKTISRKDVMKLFQIELESIETNNIWEQHWKDALIQKSKYFDNPETFIREQNTIDLAGLCTTEFGDLVYLNRSILNAVDVSYEKNICIDNRAYNNSGLGSVKKFKISPNPTTGFARVNFEYPFSGRIIVFDLKGELMMEITMNEKIDTNLDLSTYNSGVYLIKTQSDTGNIDVQKVILLNE